MPASRAFEARFTLFFESGPAFHCVLAGVDALQPDVKDDFHIGESRLSYVKVPTLPEMPHLLQALTPTGTDAAARARIISIPRARPPKESMFRHANVMMEFLTLPDRLAMIETRQVDCIFSP